MAGQRASTEQLYLDWCKRDLERYGINSEQAKCAAIEYCRLKGIDPHFKTGVQLNVDPRIPSPEELEAGPKFLEFRYYEEWELFLQRLAADRCATLPTRRIPLMRDGEQIGTLPYEFDLNYIISKSWLYVPRPGDIVRSADGQSWIADRTLGMGDIQAIPGYKSR